MARQTYTDVVLDMNYFCARFESSCLPEIWLHLSLHKYGHTESYREINRQPQIQKWYFITVAMGPWMSGQLSLDMYGCMDMWGHVQWIWQSNF